MSQLLELESDLVERHLHSWLDPLLFFASHDAFHKSDRRGNGHETDDDVRNPGVERVDIEDTPRGEYNRGGDQQADRGRSCSGRPVTAQTFGDIWRYR